MSEKSESATSSNEAAVAEDAKIVEAEATGAASGDGDEAMEGEAKADAEKSSKTLEQKNREVTAQSHVVEAERLMGLQQYSAAIRELEAAQKLLPDDDKIAQKLDMAKTLTDRQINDAPGIIAVKNLSVKQQAVMTKFNNAMDSASKNKENKLLEDALLDVDAAKTTILRSSRLFTDQQVKGLVDRTERLKLEIEDIKEQIRLQNLQDTAEMIANEEEKAEELTKLKAKEKTLTLLKRARELSRELKFRKAQDLVAQVLFDDPNNIPAQIMQDMIRINLQLRSYDSLKKELESELTSNALLNEEIKIPYAQLLMYPPDWPKLTVERLNMVGASSPENELNRQTLAKLEQRIPVDFQGNPFETVIQYIRSVTGTNIFVNWRSMEDIGITRDQAVDMKLQNVPARVALQKILDNVSGGSGEVAYEVNDGIVEIGSREFLARVTRTIRPYDIRDLIIHIPDYDEPPEFDLEGALAAAAAAGGGGGGLFTGGGDDEPIPEEELIEQIRDLIMNLVDRDNWVDNGGTVSEMRIHSGTLLVTTTPENHREIMRLLGMLRDQRALTLSVESRFLFVTEGFLEDIGVNFGMQLQADWAVNDIIGIQQASSNHTNLATFTPTVPNSIIVPGAGTPSFGFGEIAGNVLTGAGAGLIIDDLQLNLMIRATQTDRRSINVQTPRITLFNGQRAYMLFANQQGYISELNPVVAENAIAFDPVVGVLSTGVVLDVEATVSADRRYVTMNLRPSLSTPVGGGLTTFNLTDTIANAGPRIQLPNVQITQVRTAVSIPDKGTLLIGGQRQVVDTRLESGTPGLSKLPFLNRLFSNRSQVEEELTILVLVRPTIIIQSEQEQKLFPGLQQSADIFSVRQ